MTRIVILAHSHPAISLGGGEVAAYREFQEFLRLGAEAVFVGMTNNGRALPILFRGGQRVVENGPSDYVVKCSTFDNFGYDFMDIADEDWLVEFLAGFEADVFHFHHFWNIGIGTIRRLRALKPDAVFVMTLHEYQAICAADGQMLKRNSLELCTRSSPIACALCCADHGPFDYLMRRRKLRRMLDVFDLVLSPSEFLRDRFIEWGVAPERVTVLENGLHHAGEALGPPAPATVRASRFAYFGQATPTKGLNVLIDAAAHLAAGTDKRITIDVYGVTLERFREFWPGKTAPPTVSFRGRYHPEDVIPLMRQFGWIVMPSIWWENSPVVIQEARAAGVPMIASRLGGVLEKTVGWSLHFNTGDPIDLARVVESVAGEPHLLEAETAKITPPLDVTEFVTRFLALLPGRLPIAVVPQPEPNFALARSVLKTPA